MFQWGWKGWFIEVHTFFCLFWLTWSHSVKCCHAGKGRTRVQHFGLCQNIPANTSEPSPGSGTGLSSHSQWGGPASLGDISGTKSLLLLSWRLWHREEHPKFSVICVKDKLQFPPFTQRSTQSCGALWVCSQRGPGAGLWAKCPEEVALGWPWDSQDEAPGCWGCLLEEVTALHLKKDDGNLWGHPLEEKALGWPKI